MYGATRMCRGTKIMPTPVTPNLNLAKPEVNGVETENTWGFDVNDNFDKIDAFLGNLATGEDAPIDGVLYGRQDKAWVPAATADHSHDTSVIVGFDEDIDDRVAGLLVAGTNITLNYDDDAGELLISAIAGGGSGVASGDWGDVVVSAAGTVWTIDQEAVTFVKMQTMASGYMLGRFTTGQGIIEQLSLNQVRDAIGAASGAHTHPISDIVGLQPALDGKVSRTGDTMTGPLVVPGATVTANDLAIRTAGSASLVLDKKQSGQVNGIYGRQNAVPRWVLRPGNDLAEGGGNAGSNFDLLRYADNGTLLGRAFEIRRNDGSMTIDGAVTAPAFTPSLGMLTLGGYGGAGVNAGILYFGNTGTKYLHFDGSGFNFNGSRLIANTDVTAYHGAGTDGAIYLNKAETAFLKYEAGAYSLVGGNLNAAGITCTSLNLSGGPFTGVGAITCTSLDAGTGAIKGGPVTCSSLNLTGPFTCTALTCTTIAATGAITSKTTATSGSVQFGASGASLAYSGGAYSLTGGHFTASNQINALGSISAAGYRCRPGYNGALKPNVFNFDWDGQLRAWMDDAYIGTVYTTALLEKDLQPLKDEIADLRARLERLEAR